MAGSKIFHWLIFHGFFSYVHKYSTVITSIIQKINFCITVFEYCVIYRPDFEGNW